MPNIESGLVLNSTPSNVAPLDQARCNAGQPAEIEHASFDRTIRNWWTLATQENTGEYWDRVSEWLYGSARLLSGTAVAGELRLLCEIANEHSGRAFHASLGLPGLYS